MSQLPQQLNIQPKQVHQMQKILKCDFCGGDHPNGHCAPPEEEHFEEEANYVQNQGQQRNYPGNYQGNYQSFRPGGNQNFGGQGSQNQNQFGWRPQGNQPYANRPPQQLQQQQPHQPDRLSKLEETLNQFMQMTMSNQKNTEASIKNLEVQVGQMAKQIAEMNTTKFSGNTQTNPKEHCNVVVTRSGALKQGEDSVKGKEKEAEEGTHREEEVNMREERPRQSQSKHIPYPTTISKAEKEKQYLRFLDIFKKLQISIPFSEALEQMPTYAKFMKELLTKKRKLKDTGTIELEAGCSAIIQNPLPKKSRDPGSFTIPVSIGPLSVGKALLDLGASINLMPLSMLKRIGEMEVKPTRMTLQLADRTVKIPHGIVEDVLVRVDKFIFPVDFVVMDIEEDAEVPLILGRPFMHTAKVIIDVHNGNFTLRVQDEELQFDICETMKHTSNRKECFRMEILDEALQARKQGIGDPSEKVLMNEEVKESDGIPMNFDTYKEVPPDVQPG